MSGFHLLLMGTEMRRPTGSNFVASFLAVATAPLVTFNTDGTVTENDGGSGAYSNIVGAGEGSNWMIYFHKDSGTGTTNGAAEDVWLALSSARAKGMAAAGAGQVRNASLTYYLSLDGAATVAGTGTITLMSDRS